MFPLTAKCVLNSLVNRLSDNKDIIQLYDIANSLRVRLTNFVYQRCVADIAVCIVLNNSDTNCQHSTCRDSGS